MCKTLLIILLLFINLITSDQILHTLIDILV